MRKIVPLCIISMLTACHGKSLPDGSVAVDVTARGFTASCVTVTAEDPSSGKKVQQQASADLARGTTQTFALIGNEAWGPTLTVTIEAHEKSCDGNVVAKASQQVTLPPDGVAHSSFTLAARDDDADGWVSAAQSPDPGSDCDDAPDGGASIHPNAVEVCGNEIDDDCDGKVDDGDSNFPTWYRDADKDGYGATASTMQACAEPDAGWVRKNGDCDDTRGAVHPGATEVCDGADDDCDGMVDDGVPSLTLYADGDHDGFGDPNGGAAYCEETNGTLIGRDGGVLAPGAAVLDDTDCNDSNAQVHPGSQEICNGMDDDCDGTVDDGLDQTLYADRDDDGYGDPTTAGSFCQEANGKFVATDGSVSAWSEVADDSDCDDDPDGGASVNPGQLEICGNGINDDCSGVADDAPDAGAWVTWRLDADDDGYGVDAGSVVQCARPAGGPWVTGAIDCDDGDPFTYPNAPGICDQRANDCASSLTLDFTEPGCPADAGWASHSLPTSPNLFTTANYGSGQVWIAGDNDFVAVQPAPDAGFQTVSTFACGIGNGTWTASWASNAALVLLGGQNLSNNPPSGEVVQLQPDGTCAVRVNMGQDAGSVNGVFGYSISDGGLGFYAVTANGQVFHDGTYVTPTPIGGGTASTRQLTDIHGISPTDVLAVGSSKSGPNWTPRAYFLVPDGGWSELAAVPTGGPGSSTQLLGTWMVDDHLAYAVGTNDFVVKWDGTSWIKLTGPEPGANLSSVLAYGASDVYVATSTGNVWRSEQDGGWRGLYFDGGTHDALHDVTGVDPSDIWAVGADGGIVHWHEQ